jgi:septal ring factor EnvC (AmiA/AmiB activator)
MSTSLESVPLKYRSSSDYLASLPPWRRLLARLNWHPVREIEIETWRVRIEKERLRRESEQIRNETEQIRKEAEQIRKEAEQMRTENERLRQERLRWKQLDAQIEALFCSDASCSIPATPIDDGSTPS